MRKTLQCSEVARLRSNLLLFSNLEGLASGAHLSTKGADHLGSIFGSVAIHAVIVFVVGAEVVFVNRAYHTELVIDVL